ncbi:MAG: hypothetical protein V4732_12620 [Pseudomonadota bacterium]
MKNSKCRSELNRNYSGELTSNKHFQFFKYMAGGLCLALSLTEPIRAETHLANQQQTNQQITDVSDVSFGRLFTTPEQRKSLDEARRRGGLRLAPQIVGVDESTTDLPLLAKQQIAQPFKLSGVLLRADGQHQVWVSGESGKAENPDFSRKILGNTLHSANVKVPLQGNNRAAILKPGQVWLPDSDRAEESYRLAIPKPVVVPEPAKKRVIPPVASSSTSMQTSASVSEVHSSVQSSKK